MEIVKLSEKQIEKIGRISNNIVGIRCSIEDLSARRGLLHHELWATIRKMFPKLKEEKNMSFDHEKFEITIKD